MTVRKAGAMYKIEVDGLSAVFEGFVPGFMHVEGGEVSARRVIIRCTMDLTVVPRLLMEVLEPELLARPAHEQLPIVAVQFDELEVGAFAALGVTSFRHLAVNAPIVGQDRAALLRGMREVEADLAGKVAGARAALDAMESALDSSGN